MSFKIEKLIKRKENKIEKYRAIKVIIKRDRKQLKLFQILFLIKKKHYELTVKTDYCFSSTI